MNRNNKKPKLNIVLLITVAICVIVTDFPYLHEGIGGYYPDLAYHLLRVEGVKNALTAHAWPAEVYDNFFHGYGYAGPLFYPDIFLLPAALLRLMGFSPEASWKLFAALVTVVVSLSTYLSIRMVLRIHESRIAWTASTEGAKDPDTVVESKRRESAAYEKVENVVIRAAGRNELMAAAGTLLLVLSQFYLADLQVRVGISEYMAFAFLPILVAGWYAFFHDSSRTGAALIGLALAGLLLTHTISALIGLLLTVIVFLFMLFGKSGRAALSRGWKELLLSAVVTALWTAFYLLPMLEQMLSGTEFGYRHPWAMIGEMTQPFIDFFDVNGYFFNIAHVGIGIPVLLAVFLCVVEGRSKDRWGDALLWGGIALLLAMTDLLPWHALQNTILNMLQFTFRLYPAALCLIAFGVCLKLSEMKVEGQETAAQSASAEGGTERDQDSNPSDSGFSVSGRNTAAINGRFCRTVSILAILTVLFAIWQNISAMQRAQEGGVSGYHTDITEEALSDEDSFVGMGEWLPVHFNTEITAYPFVYLAPASEDGEPVLANIPYERSTRRVGGAFAVEGEPGIRSFIVPQVFYKGYSGLYQNDETGQSVRIEAQESPWGQVMITGEFPGNGRILVTYRRTALQKGSMLVSMLTVLVLVICAVRKSSGKAVK